MERSGWFTREGMNDDERRHALSHELGVPFVALDPHDIAVEALMLVPEPLAREHNIVGYALGERGLELALLDLADLPQVDFLRARYRLLPRLTSRQSMTRALIRYQRHLQGVYGKALERADSPNLLETLLRHMTASGAAAAHLQLGHDSLSVRYRINGMLREAVVLPPQTGRRVVDTLRALAGLPKSALPREARLRVELGDEAVVLRVATVPTVDGEKLTLHLTRDAARRGYTLESLGLHGEGLEALHRALLARRGLVTVVGGPQSGKTTLLYTLLDSLNTPEVSVATVEQEVTQTFKRAAQTDVGASGLSTAGAVRAALRQDPDVLLVDGVEDTETATLAAAAAGRGALVVAASAGADLPPADLAVRTAVVRKLCAKHFLDKAKLTRAQADDLEARGADFAKVLAVLKEEGKVGKEVQWKDVHFARPTPCSECQDGYQGRLGLQEVAAPGYQGLNLLEDGLYKAAQGLTTIDELTRI